MTIYNQYCKLDIETRWIGLEKANESIEYFCTPLNANIIGWENSIHYCFLKGYDEVVFAVNPESCVDKFVYPLANNFENFLRLILVCGSTTAVEQIIGWNKQQFDEFIISDYNQIYPEQQIVLDTLKEKLNLEPLENPFEYVKSIQDNFDYSKINFSSEYYDTLGLERPDGSESEENIFEFEPVVFSFLKKK